MMKARNHPFVVGWEFSVKHVVAFVIHLVHYTIILKYVP